MWVRFVFLAGPGAAQIFNDLDVQDDKLMLDLAVFLNRLVRRDYTVVLLRECQEAVAERLHVFRAVFFVLCCVCVLAAPAGIGIWSPCIICGGIWCHFLEYENGCFCRMKAVIFLTHKF